MSNSAVFAFPMSVIKNHSGLAEELAGLGATVSPRSGKFAFNVNPLGEDSNGGGMICNVSQDGYLEVECDDITTVVAVSLRMKDIYPDHDAYIFSNVIGK